MKLKTQDFEGEWGGKSPEDVELKSLNLNGAYLLLPNNKFQLCHP